MAAYQHAVVAAVAAVAAAVALAGCGKRATQGDEAGDAALLSSPRPVDAAGGAARIEIDAAPIKKEDVLEGTAAEQALAAGASEGTTATPSVDAATGSGLTIRPDGIGPWALRAPRDRIAQRLGARARIEKTASGGGEPTREVAKVSDAKGPYLAIRLLGGRVVSIDVLAARPGLATEAGLGLGTTFDAAVDLYGPPRPVADARGAKLGWTFEDLPGVVVRGGGAAASGAIRAISVIGPEATAAPD